MVRASSQTAAVRGVLIGKVFEHPTLWEFVGKYKYLQVAVSKAVARAYVAKFGAVTGKDLCCVAAYEGSLSLLLWARKVGCEWNDDVFLAAVRGGQITMLQWWEDTAQPFNQHNVLEAFLVAVNSCNLKTLEWLYQNKAERHVYACAAAGRVGWLDGLKWLRSHGFPWDQGTWSAQNGHIDVYKWAHHNGCPGNHEGSVHHTAKEGQIEMLKLMLQDGCYFDENVCAHAAALGQLPTLQWLRANNAPWNARTITWARDRGHLDVVRWARENTLER